MKVVVYEFDSSFIGKNGTGIFVEKHPVTNNNIGMKLILSPSYGDEPIVILNTTRSADVLNSKVIDLPDDFIIELYEYGLLKYKLKNTVASLRINHE